MAIEITKILVCCSCTIKKQWANYCWRLLSHITSTAHMEIHTAFVLTPLHIQSRVMGLDIFSFNCIQAVLRLDVSLNKK